VSAIQGNLYEFRHFSGVRLLDIELPRDFASAYPGPAFGVEGTRRLTGVYERPVIGTIVKPSVGLTPQATGELAMQLAKAGVDFIKDDELMTNPPHSPLADRVTAVMGALKRHADRTGKLVMYGFNITDDFDAMMRHHDVVYRAGGTCVMVNLNCAGLAAVAALRRRCKVPIHGHRCGWGMHTRHPMLGIDFTAYQKLWRLAGVDHHHVNGLANKFWEDDDSVVRSIEAVRRPLLGGYDAMPVVLSGQWGGQAPDTYRRTGTVDVMYLAGGGIMSHPDGPASGVAAVRQAWEAAVAGATLDEYAGDHPELRRAIEKFGRRA
jgi:ribulose-bisphosphate carboxylase large chain